MWPGLHLIYTTAKGISIYVAKGRKSQYNFRVRYREPGKRIRTPKHIHLIIDLYMKRMGDKSLTMHLVDHIIDEIILKVCPSSSNIHLYCKFSLPNKQSDSKLWINMVNIL